MVRIRVTGSGFSAATAVAIGLYVASMASMATMAGVPTADKPRTLEDLFGDTANRFQGAIGFQVREARATTEAASGFGLAVDDVVLQWREFTLEEDQTDCALSGSCATINLQTNNIFAGNTIVTIEVLDRTPDPANDCDHDGTPDGTRDCDGNGVDDVVVRVSSAQELAGEIVVAKPRRTRGLSRHDRTLIVV